MTMSDLLVSNKDDLTNHDLASLADWAGKKVHAVPHPEWKRAYSLIREGSDLLLRRRAKVNDNGFEKENEHAASNVKV
jgi:hypothetical protein